MRRGQRPSRHYRIVATKLGRKRIFINPNIKKIIHKKITKTSFSAYPIIEPKKEDLFEDYMTGGIEKGEIEEVDPKEFVNIRDKMPGWAKEEFLSLYNPTDLHTKGIKTYLTENKDAGFGLTPEGEIVNVFSLKKGQGKTAMLHAIEKGGFKLDTLAKKPEQKKGLPEYYEQFGFKEVRRKENWEKGKQDVIFMER